jgi:CBS domain-containing protein
MNRPIETKEYMLKKPITVKPETSVLDAARHILDHRISGVCVIDDDNNLVGVLSELDCLRAIIGRIHQQGQPDAGLVADAMTTEVKVNHPHDDIISVASSMLDSRQRRRPISVEGKLVGQVTCRQILKAIKDFAVPSDPSERTQ